MVRGEEAFCVHLLLCWCVHSGALALGAFDRGPGDGGTVQPGPGVRGGVGWGGLAGRNPGGKMHDEYLRCSPIIGRKNAAGSS